MNNFWGKETINSIKLEFKIKVGEVTLNDEKIVETCIFWGRKHISKEVIDNYYNSLYQRIMNLDLDDEDRYSRIGAIDFEYAIIYRYFNHLDMYKKLMYNSESMLLNGIPQKKKYSEITKYRGFGFFKVLKRVHSLIMLRKFEDIYALITRKKGKPHECIEFAKWDYCSIDEILYTLDLDLDCYMTNKNESVEAQIKLYYALYLYLTTEDNKETFKKIILNNAQKMIEHYAFAVYDEYIQLLDLSMEFPEIFGDILETPHKIVPADESLLSFNLVKPLTPLSKEEEESIKKMKKTSLKALMNKPKGIKKQKELIREYVVLRHNS
ncbi:MAG: hypothetical protein ACRC7N_18110, partial [Clostridium sp.]